LSQPSNLNTDWVSLDRLVRESVVPMSFLRDADEILRGVMGQTILSHISMLKP
jgi:hypothetical protein